MSSVPVPVRSPRRPSAGDAGWAALLLVFMVFGTFGSAQGQEDAPRDLDSFAVALAASAVAALAWRRVAPRGTVLYCGIAAATFLGVGYPFGPVLLALSLATLSAAWLLPTSRSLPPSAAAVGILAAGLTARWAQDPGLGAAAAIGSTTGWLIVPWSVGAVLRLRAEGRTRAKREQAEGAAHAERLRIAAEVHDVAGHGLAVIAMQAGVALHVLERRPEQARIALEEIRAASTEALDGLRTTLASLRSPGAEAPLAPGLPGLDDLPALVERIQRAGLAVELTETGPAVEPAPPEVGAAAYRIVQESLTNVLRHAGASRASVALEWTDGFLRVSVRDDGTAGPAAEGAGIAGMRERAERLGGVLGAQPAAGGGFEVNAALPYRGSGSSGRLEASA